MKRSHLCVLAILSIFALALFAGCQASGVGSGTSPTTQPIASDTNPLQMLVTLAKEGGAVAANPAVQAVAPAIPYGNIVLGALGGLGLLGTALGAYLGNKSGQQSGISSTLQSATNTSTAADAAAAAHQALAIIPGLNKPANAAAINEAANVIGAVVSGKPV